MKNNIRAITARLLLGTVLSYAGSLACSGLAGTLQIQSNPVNFGTVYWGNPTSWDSLNIPRYQLDTPGDGTYSRDVNFISIAHDSSYFYVRVNFNQAPQFSGDFYLWLDTDTNANTGMRNFSGHGAIGAEYVIQGAAVIRNPAAWTFVDYCNWDEYPPDSGDIARDIIFSLNRSTEVTNVTSFDFTYQLYNSFYGITGDWYPDSADSLSGDSFRYTTLGVPAPSPTSSSVEYGKLVTGAGPLAYYRLNETNTPAPDVATNSGTVGSAGNGVYTIGAVHPVAGALAGDGDTAANFTGVDTSSEDGGVPVLIPYSASLNPAGSFTVEAWLRPTLDGNGNAQCPFYNRDPQDASPNRVGWDFFQRASGTGWNFRMFNGNGHSRVFDVTGGAYTVGQWCHLVAVYDASAPSVTLYLNGQQVAFNNSPNGSFNPNTSFPMAIGCYSDASQNPFVGDIDEFAVYSSALSSARVLAHYQNGINASRSVPYSSLVIADGAAEYLRLDEPAKNVAHNSGTLGTNADGVYNLHTATAYAGPRAAGNLGFEANNSSAFFNGGNSYVELRNPPALNFTGALTLEAWIQPSVTPAAPGGFGDIIGHGYDDYFDEVALRVDAGSGTQTYAIATYTPAGGQGTSATVPVEDLGTGAWVHLVGTFDGSNWNLYRNGVLLSSSPDTAGSVIVAAGNWAVGARGRWAHMDALTPTLNRQFQGAIDEPAIYNRALTPAEILAHYVVGVSNNPVLNVVPSGNSAVLDWPVGTLQQANDVRGPYTDVSTLSPYTIPADSSMKFYRLKL